MPIEEKVKELYQNRKKKNKIMKDLNWQIILIITLGILLACFYGCHISSLHALWELGDEAVYLWNAAYFTGTDWDNFAGEYAYCAYGYSVVLIPLFWIVNNGIQLVKGAYVINVLCVLGMYLILIKLLKEMTDKPRSLSIPIIAFISSLTPYTVSNTLKVLCENFLAFWYSLLVLLLCLAIKRQKKIYMILLGICGAFIFYIHTRAIVAVGLLGLTMILNAIKKKGKQAEYAILSIILMMVFLVLLYLIKVNIIEYKSAAKQAAGMGTEVGNIIRLSNISTTLQWLSLGGCFSHFIAKIFYSVSATGAVLMPGFLCMGKRVCAFWKAKDSMGKNYAVSIVMSFVMAAYGLMIVAVVLMGTGADLRYLVYGRYYEYMLPVILSFCLFFFIESSKEISRKEMLMCLIFVLCIGVGTQFWCISNLPKQDVFIDTNRLASWSKAITMNGELDAVLNFLILVYAGYMFCYAVVYKKKYAKWIVLPMVFISLWVNNVVCLDEIHNIHNKTIGDTEIAEYLINNVDSEKIYMLDDNSFRIPFYYSKMQVYLKDNRLYVMEPKESEHIETGSYVIVYSSTGLKETILSDYQFLMQGPAFILYQK